jgi:hypothetical protein
MNTPVCNRKAERGFVRQISEDFKVVQPKLKKQKVAGLSRPFRIAACCPCRKTSRCFENATRKIMAEDVVNLTTQNESAHFIELN